MISHSRQTTNCHCLQCQHLCGELHVHGGEVVVSPVSGAGYLPCHTGPVLREHHAD